MSKQTALEIKLEKLEQAMPTACQDIVRCLKQKTWYSLGEANAFLSGAYIYNPAIDGSSNRPLVLMNEWATLWYQIKLRQFPLHY